MRASHRSDRCTPPIGIFKLQQSALAMLSPERRLINPPGPVTAAMRLRSFSVLLFFVSISSIFGSISASTGRSSKVMMSSVVLPWISAIVLLWLPKSRKRVSTGELYRS